MGIRILVAGVIGGILFFAASAAFHMATPLGHTGLKQLPSEDSVIAALKPVPEDGMYMFPGMDMSHPTAEEMAAWEEKAKAGPWGLIIFHPGGTSAMSPTTLGIELASNIGACLLAALIAVRISGFISRLLAVSLLGPISWLSISASYWNWYGFPRDYSLAAFVMETACWIIAGVAIAAIARAGRPAATGSDSTGTYEVAA